MCNPQQLQNKQKQSEQQHPSEHQLQQQAGSAKSQSSSDSPPVSPTAAYALYLHREELRRRKAPHSARTSMTKIQLTNELIARTKQNINACSFEDLEILARETLFKKNLQRHLHYRRMAMQAWMQKRRQGKLVKRSS